MPASFYGANVLAKINLPGQGGRRECHNGLWRRRSRRSQTSGLHFTVTFAKQLGVRQAGAHHPSLRRYATHILRRHGHARATHAVCQQRRQRRHTTMVEPTCWKRRAAFTTTASTDSQMGSRWLRTALPACNARDVAVYSTVKPSTPPWKVLTSVHDGTGATMRCIGWGISHLRLCGGVGTDSHQQIAHTRRMRSQG